MIPTIIQGAAMAFFFIPLVTITLSGLTPDRIPAASGLSNFARITAGSFGTSISTTLWDHRATLHHAQLAERISGADAATTQALGALQAGGLTPGAERWRSSTGWSTSRRSCWPPTTVLRLGAALPAADRRRLARSAGEGFGAGR